MLKKVSFQRKLYVYYSLFIIFIMVLMVITFYTYMSKLLIANASKEMLQILDKISSSLDYQVKEADRVISQVLFSKDIQQIMSDIPLPQTGGANYFDSNYESASKVRTLLTAINSPNVTVRRLTVFNEFGSFVSVGKVGISSLGYKDVLPQIKKYKTDDKHLIFLPPHNDSWLISSESTKVLSYIRNFSATYTYSNHIGYIEVQQPYSDIEAICTTNYKSNVTVLIMNDAGDIIYPIEKYDKDKASYYFSLKGSNGNIFKRPWDNANELVYGFRSSYAGWNIILAQSKNDFMSPINLIQKFVVIIGVLFAFTTLFIIYIISRKLTSPIKELRNLVKSLSLENLSIQLSDATQNDDISLLNEAFSKTLTRLRASIDETILAKAGENHAHLLALQAQMNPHFLYNTLMGISAMGESIGSMEIVLMCAQLSEMLRYSASFKNNKIFISHEIKHAENYLKLTKWRYGEKLTYNIDIPSEMLDIECPKLILQPIIENCFYHGFKNSRPPYEVKIKGYFENDIWILEIADNGQGFMNNEIQEIFARVDIYKLDTSSGKIFENLEIGGMGIINIYMRLNILYKDSSVFQIINNAYGGSTVRIGGLRWKP